jgi:B-cell receptor-associated protein 31
MIQLLFTVIFTEATMIALLLFKTPLRKLVIMALDRLKRGRGPLMVKTVAGTLVIVLSSSVYSMINIQKRGIEDAAAVNPTDQVLMAKHLLEATLMGMYGIDFILFIYFFSYGLLILFIY